jgi:hypothetical protein
MNAQAIRYWHGKLKSAPEALFPHLGKEHADELLEKLCKIHNQKTINEN